LQDYNSSVLSLVTLPNLILSSLPFLPSSSITYETADDEETVSYTEPGTLALSSELLSAFTDLLKTHSITLEFSCGDWSNFAQSISQPFNLVLTAETIYSENSIGALLDVLQRASEPIGSDWENSLQQSGADRSLRALADGASVVLVAAKVRRLTSGA
jgi:protein-histidine N-methyltransferase